MLKINSIKTIYLLFGLSTLSIILHNAISAYFKIEEPVFFILTFVFFLSFVISVIYSTVSCIKKGEPRDLWKLGWIGLFGLLGLAGSPGLYGFFGFFGFLGAKRWKMQLTLLSDRRKVSINQLVGIIKNI